MKDIISITDVNVNNNEDIIVAISNGSICIFNKSYNSPEYIIDAHLKKVTGFIWIENQKMIISASMDKTIKVYQFPLKWPAEFLRKNKHINKLNIVNEIKTETKNLYDELYSIYRYSNNNNDEENNNKNYEGIWNIGNNKKDKKELKNNEIISDFWKYQKEMENKRKNEDENENEQENNNSIESEDDENEINTNSIVYPKPDKYDDIDIIFCDDLNGWSKPKRLID